jgi:surface polysaccharide O-acyltransferase-like enzyme
MGVPLFFMVSGYLLLGKVEPISVFFRKRFVKVGIPALFWTAFYLLWSVEAYSNRTMTLSHAILSMLKAIYIGDVEIHLWFLYILVGIYLVVPVLRVYVSAASRRDLIFFISMWFIATSLLELLQQVTGYKTALVIPVVGGYVGYFVLGYLLSDVNLSRQGLILSIVGMMAATGFTYVGTDLFSTQPPPLNRYFYSYFSLPTVLASTCGYLFMKSIGRDLGRVKNPILAVSASSFGIYLIHILVIELLRNKTFGFRLYAWMGPAWYMIPLTALAAYSISFFIVFIMRKIPIVKVLVP